jgi:ERCC4-type nuclease
LDEPNDPSQRLYIDSRETRSQIPAMLKQAGVPFDMEEMPAGDYRLGPYLIERKTVNDLAASIFDGRLFEQAEAVCNSADRPMLLIEGDLASGQSQIQDESLYGAISSLTVFWGLQIIFMPSTAASARFLVRLHKHMTEGLGYEVATRVAKPKVAPDGAAAQYLVCGLPGVGPELARKLLTHFGSANKVFQASELDLRSCKGVGPSTARKIVLALEHRPNCFRSTKSAPDWR